MLATQYASDYRIEAQREGESDYDFKYRVAGELRDRGNAIEAHEVMANGRHDDPERGGDVMTGLMGMMAMALHGVDYGSRGGHRVDDECVCGTLQRYEMSPEGQARRRSDNMMAHMLSNGFSPDDIREFGGR